MTDRGNASIEFLALAVVLLVPLVYVLLFAFELQRATFATTAAAREAGRAAVTSGPAAAQAAADRALADQLPGEPHAKLRLVPTATDVTATVTVVVEMPLAGRWARVPVTATHVAPTDRYRSR